MAAHFEPVVDANCRLAAPPPTRRTAIGGYPKVASYDMLGGQLGGQNGGMARTPIQVHAVNLIEIRLGERWQPISNQS